MSAHIHEVKKKTPEGYAVAAIAQFLALLEKTQPDVCEWWLNRSTPLRVNAKGKFFIKKKHSPLEKDGLGDIGGCWRGRLVEFEVKAKDKPLRDTQKHRMARLEACGGAFFRVESIDDVQNALKVLDEPWERTMAALEKTVRQSLEAPTDKRKLH